MVALAPVWFELDALVTVSSCLLIPLEVVVSGTSVSKNGVVVGSLFECLGPHVNGALKVLGLELIVSEFFEVHL